MTEKVTKQYYCDFCGAEIDQNKYDGLRIFNTNHNKEGLTIRPIRQSMDAHRQIAIVVQNGDFCNIDHLMQYITKRLNEERKCKGMSIP